MVRQIVWALNKVLLLEGANASFWNGAWDQIQAKSISQAGEYFAKSKITPSKTLHDTYIANWLHPWILWADENEIFVPERVREMAPTELIYPSTTP